MSGILQTSQHTLRLYADTIADLSSRDTAVFRYKQNDVVLVKGSTAVGDSGAPTAYRYHESGRTGITVDGVSFLTATGTDDYWQIMTDTASGGVSINHITLTAGDIASKFVGLPSTPTSATDIGVFIVGGTPQHVGTDWVYDAVNNRIDWTGRILETLLVPGDRLLVIYR